MIPKTAFKQFRLLVKEAVPAPFESEEQAPLGTRVLIHNARTYLKLRRVPTETADRVMADFRDALRKFGRGAVFIRTIVLPKRMPDGSHLTPLLREIKNVEERRVFLEVVGAMQFMHAWGNKTLGAHVFNELGFFSENRSKLGRINAILQASKEASLDLDVMPGGRLQKSHDEALARLAAATRSESKAKKLGETAARNAREWSFPEFKHMLQ